MLANSSEMTAVRVLLLVGVAAAACQRPALPSQSPADATSSRDLLRRDASRERSAIVDAFPDRTPDPDVGAPATCGSNGVLHTGSERVIAVFPLLQGLFVIRSFSFLLVERDGQIKRTWISPREVFSAATDGSLFVMGDTSAVQVWDAKLTWQRDITIPSPKVCGGLVIVSGSRVACHTGGQGLLYTFWINTAELLAVSPNGLLVSPGYLSLPQRNSSSPCSGLKS